jgi:NADH:ubiquinone oxidoreductase subunit 6 (subunit J)
MNDGLIFGAYGLAALGALAVYFAMPREGRPSKTWAMLLIGAMALGGMAIFLSEAAGKASSAFMFFLLTIVAVGSAVRVVTHTRPVYSALFFIMVVLATSGLMFMAGAEFLGAALVIVYAGAILVTYVFVIMLAQQSVPQQGGQFALPSDYDRSAREPLIAVCAGFILIGSIAGVVVNHDWHQKGRLVLESNDIGNTMALGQLLMSPEFAVSVEVAGILLMVAMIGAIAIARKKLPVLIDSSIDVLPPGEIGKHVKPF